MAGGNGHKEEGSTAKPCRVCTDFRQWSKDREKEQKEQDHSPPKVESEDKDPKVDVGADKINNCPLNRDELGRRTWGFLHTMVAYYPECPTGEQKENVHDFFRLFSQFYPCSECAEDLQRQLQRFPPKTESREELSQWLCRVHNRINLRLGKPLFDCAKVNERWRDGWKDGSCD